MLPTWLLILQAVLPLIKTAVDLVKSHAPAEDAAQSHKDAHAAVVAKLEECHSALCTAKEV